MNDIMKKSLDLAAQQLDNMSDEDFLFNINEFTEEEEKNYKKEDFEKEIQKIKDRMEDGCFYDDGYVYPGQEAFNLSNLFWNYIKVNNCFSFKEHGTDFPTYITELRDYGMTITEISGQGTMHIFSLFDFKNEEYNKKVELIKKREEIEQKINENSEFMRDKAKTLDIIDFFYHDRWLKGVVVNYSISIDNICYHIFNEEFGAIEFFVNKNSPYKDKIKIEIKHESNIDNLYY